MDEEDDFQEDDEVDPAIWDKMVVRLRRMKTVEETEDFDDPDPFI